MANVSSYKEDFTMSTPVFEKDLTGLLVVDPYNDFISAGGILWPLAKEIAEAIQCVPIRRRNQMVEPKSAANEYKISRDRLVGLLNEDLSREYQAICSSSRTVLPVVRPMCRVSAK
jgi:hypothetical protein